jgi:hypothetical protein
MNSKIFEYRGAHFFGGKGVEEGLADLGGGHGIKVLS